jgi:hypothetical protein
MPPIIAQNPVIFSEDHGVLSPPPFPTFLYKPSNAIYAFKILIKRRSV